MRVRAKRQDPVRLARSARLVGEEWVKKFIRWALPCVVVVMCGAGWTGPHPVGAEAADKGSKGQGLFHYDAAGRRDPFEPLVRDGKLVSATDTRETVRPVLYGILWDPGGQSIALINSAEYKVGDAVGTYQVSEIRRDAVVLTGGGEPLVLQIAFEAPSGSSPGTTKGGGRQ